ncbi:efflux RND transporter periplasmic adaptor subunit [Pedobacter chitinilyticus]|uniref:Efflux RND transporter periplasmic adaptor subunit n=1 Tax=Pedobacter chitinilyticus TaxID=2233776 RepID=A0A3S3PY57_9SPHI|nr:efflux RND transporter periplasmic adaptor subunit [Pedobacter chitinilyticus]RWU05587.1 efflux RND transporter periplasmic adaptor subunit [Pedobacter chitinilyticus]
MKKRYIFYLVLALGLAYLVYYRITENKKIEGGGPGGAGPGKGGKGKGGAPLNVDGIIAATSDFSSNIDITGSIEANEAVTLRSEVAGLVTGIYFKEGSNVSKGAALVKINDRDIQAQLREVITRQNLSASNENRAKQLLAKGAISQEEYDTSLAELQALKSQVQLIRAQLAKTTIIAPFSGKVGLRNISMGEYITPNTTIANLLSTNPVKINFSIPEKYVSQLKSNSDISFNIDGSNKTFSGKVFAIEPGINQTTRTLQIKALAQNASGELLPGSFAKVKLSLSTIKDAILIPTEAVIPVLKGKVVYISKNGKAQQMPVETGTRTADKILVLSGLNVGDTVLTTGAMALKPDADVKVKIAKK